jgi:hypothetical protein
MFRYHTKQTHLTGTNSFLPLDPIMVLHAGPSATITVMAVRWQMSNGPGTRICRLRLGTIRLRASSAMLIENVCIC